MKNHQVLDEIAKIVYEHFPGVNLEFEYVDQTGEIFVLVDSARVYSSEKYQALIANIKSTLLWPKGHYEIFFGVAEDRQDFLDISFAPGYHAEYLPYQVGIDMSFYNWTSRTYSQPDLSKAA